MQSPKMRVGLRLSALKILSASPPPLFKAEEKYETVALVERFQGEDKGKLLWSQRMQKTFGSKPSISVTKKEKLTRSISKAG